MKIVSGEDGAAAAEIDNMNTQRLSTDDLKVWLTRVPWLYAGVRRPYATARYLPRRPHDIDYAAFGLFPQTDGLFLDLGANAGMSSMSLADLPAARADPCPRAQPVPGAGPQVDATRRRSHGIPDLGGRR